MHHVHEVIEELSAYSIDITDRNVESPQPAVTDGGCEADR